MDSPSRAVLPRTRLIRVAVAVGLCVFITMSCSRRVVIGLPVEGNAPYSPVRANQRGEQLLELQKRFDAEFAPEYSEQDFRRIKWFVRCLAELERQYIGETNFGDLVYSAVFGMAAHAAAVTGSGIHADREWLTIGETTYAVQTSRDRSVAAELQNLRVFEMSFRVLRDHNKSLRVEDLVNAAVYGMCRDLGDPYTRSSPAFPEVARAMSRRDRTLMLDSVGLELVLVKGETTILRVEYDYTAYSAGLKRNDRIQAVNRQSVRGLPLEEVKEAMDRPVNELTVLRATEKGQRELRFLLPNVLLYDDSSANNGTYADEVAEGIGYLRLGEFRDPGTWMISETKGGQHSVVAEALASFRRKDMHAVILDLRGNGGGLGAESIVDLFLPAGAVVSEESRKWRPPKRVRTYGAPQWNGPLVVLVDADSASASELVSSTLRDHRRAVIVGSQTFGKATAWIPIWNPQFDAHICINMTLLRSPSRDCIDRVGLTPDVRFVPGDDDPQQARRHLPAFRAVRTPDELAMKLLEVSFDLLRSETMQARWSLPSRLGDEYFRMRDTVGAEKKYCEALEGDPSDSHAAVGLGNLCRHHGDSQLAMRYYALAKAWAPDDAEAHFQTGVTQLWEDDLEGAAQSLRQALKCDRFHPGAEFHLGLALRGMREAEQARKHFERSQVYHARILGR